MSVCSSTSVSISPNTASSMTFSVQPFGLYPAGLIWTVQPIVQVLDAYGNRISGFPVELVAFSSSDCSSLGLGSLSNNIVISTSGYSVFPALSYTKAEAIFIKAVSNSIFCL